MQEIMVTDPDDVFYPLIKHMYEDKNIVYHGTSSCFMERIEKKGWCKNDQHNNISHICETFESLDFFLM